MHQNYKNIPGLVIAGLKGGTGKTVISLGIVTAWRELDIKIAPFKKGPDYIDAGWLAQAAGRPCYNLDTFLCTTSQVLHSFNKNSALADIAVVEGNRGLYDGIDTEGTTSTAEIAKLLNLPVLLVLDCTKSTRTMAALLMGCIHFDPHVNILGVVLNRVAGKRHEGKVRDNIRQFCNIPVFGSVPKLKAEDFPERHMGLVPSVEHELAIHSIKAAARVARSYIDLDALYKACAADSEKKPLLTYPSQASPLLCGNCLKTLAPDPTPSSLHIQKTPACPSTITGESISKPAHESFNTKPSIPKKDRPVIGIVRDSAFQFYYPDNLEALEENGAVLKLISPLKEDSLPHVDAIYMGGGFPETHAAQLAANKGFRNHLKELASIGLPIYAECGGLIFLGKSLTLDGTTYPMSDILPLSFGLSKRPVGHGYTTVEVVNENPYFQKGEIIKGHEFRYSSIIDIDYQEKDMAFSMIRGKGIIDKKDAFCKNNVLGTYTHILSSCTPSWAVSIINRAMLYKSAC